MSKSHLSYFIRVIGCLTRPVFKARAQTMDCRIKFEALFAERAAMCCQKAAYQYLGLEKEGGSLTPAL